MSSGFEIVLLPFTHTHCCNFLRSSCVFLKCSVIAKSRDKQLLASKGTGQVNQLLTSKGSGDENEPAAVVSSVVQGILIK